MCIPPTSSPIRSCLAYQALGNRSMAVNVEAVQLPYSDIRQIVTEARDNERKEARDTLRYAFFRPVVIHDGTERLSGFSREVSETGIGLLHRASLAAGEVQIAIPTEQGFSV